jgi:glutamyl-tRNA synthetase
VGRSPAAINPTKLDWLNAQYLKRTDPDELARLVRPFLEAKGYRLEDPAKEELLRKALLPIRERAKTLVEMADLMEFYFRQELVYEPKAAEKFLGEESVAVLKEALNSLSAEAVLDKERAHLLIRRLAESRGEPLVRIAQPLRVALTGAAASPPLDEVMETLGREEVCRRLRMAIAYVEKNRPSGTEESSSALGAGGGLGGEG